MHCTPIVIETGATVDEGHTMPLSCIEDIESNLTVQETMYALVQVILHNGSQYRRITVLDNQNVFYDNKFCDEFRFIADTAKFALKEMGENYRVSYQWYRKVLNKKESSLYLLPVYPPFAEMTHPTHAMADKTINENATCGMEKPQHKKGATVTKLQKMKKDQVSQSRDIVHQINLHQNHQSAAQKTKERQMNSHPQPLQNVIMIQLGYQSERGKN